jgi:hypothetical protein
LVENQHTWGKSLLISLSPKGEIFTLTFNPLFSGGEPLSPQGRDDSLPSPDASSTCGGLQHDNKWRAIHESPLPMNGTNVTNPVKIYSV